MRLRGVLPPPGLRQCRAAQAHEARCERIRVGHKLITQWKAKEAYVAPELGYALPRLRL